MYAKLFNSITDSTIWREPNHVRIVWITMLAKADAKGYVFASIPGLADASRVSIHECEESLDRLKAPDSYSRTKEYDGRRIEEIDGGWKILNYLKYRDLRHKEDRRLYMQKYMKEYRSDNQEPVNNVNNVNNCKQKLTMLAHTEAEAYTEANTLYPMFKRFWDEYPKKSKEREKEAWYEFINIKPSEDLLCRMINAIKVQKMSEEWAKSQGKYIPMPHNWLARRYWENDHSGVIKIARTKMPSSKDLKEAI